MTTVPGSAEKQALIADYREGNISLDEAGKRIYEIDNPPQSIFTIIMKIIVSGFFPSLVR